MSSLSPLRSLAVAAARRRRRPQAAPGLRVGVTDDAWLEFGPGTLDERVAELQEMGVQVVRVTLDWYEIEAEQGTYDWARDGLLLDALRDGRDRAGRRDLGNARRGRTAAGGRTCRRPRPRRSPSFARAAAERFPWVRRWIVWNEPNQRRWLLPPSPVVYVTKLLNPGGAAIKGVIPKASIGGGATAPRGASGGMSPVDFMRGMGRAGARLDAYAHHPHPLSPAETPFTGGCSWCGTISMATLDRLVDETRAALRVAHAHLADRARVPDEPAGQDPRRDLGEAGAVRRRGAAAGVRGEPRSTCSSSTSCATSRSWARGRAGSRPWPARRSRRWPSFTLPLAQVSRTGRATTRLGAGPPRQRAPAVPPPAPCGAGWVASAARGDERAGVLHRTVRATGARSCGSTTRDARSSPTLVVRSREYLDNRPLGRRDQHDRDEREPDAGELEPRSRSWRTSAARNVVVTG